MTSVDSSSWSTLHWRRHLETFGQNDAPVLAAGPSGETNSMCHLGEVTDKGRETTLALGQRLRRLYVDQLKYLPPIISNANMIYLRATPMPRALDSVQQTFWGLYPLNARTASFPAPAIVTRTPQDETLHPNDAPCKRLAQLTSAFADRCADRWNDSPEMKYLSQKLTKWMPRQQVVAVDGHPRMSGIMDTVNATLAHGPETRLPSEFYDRRARDIIDKIASEEWFEGYRQSHEYRTLGIGALAGDVVERMVSRVEHSGNDGHSEVHDKKDQLNERRGGKTGMMLGLSGCHDTTLAALLTSLGAFDGQKWPPYTSHVAIELFRDSPPKNTPDGSLNQSATGDQLGSQNERSSSTSWLSWLTGGAKPKEAASEDSARKPLAELNEAQRRNLKGYYVRVRYNDEPVTVPGCRPEGKHWGNDETFCTLEAFKSVVDKFAPRSWKAECQQNLQAPPVPEHKQAAGFE